MASKKKELKITLGMHRGRIVTLTRKKAAKGFVIVKLAEDGREIEIHNTLVK